MLSDSLPKNRDIWRIAAPMILSNISVPLLGMVDTGVTGHLDDAAYLGAVAIGSTIFGFLYAGFNFLRMGTTGITAQRFGANDGDGLKVALGQALVVSLAIALALLLLQWPIASLSMRALGPDAGIATLADEYFFIRIWSAPATLANYALIGWFIGLQNARVPLYIVLAINLTNIVLDLIFVLLLDMKVQGVAAASVIAEFTGLAVGGAFAISCLKRGNAQGVQGVLRRERSPVGSHDGTDVYICFHYGSGRETRWPDSGCKCGTNESAAPDVFRPGRLCPCRGGARWQSGRSQGQGCAATRGYARTPMVALRVGALQPVFPDCRQTTGTPPYGPGACYRCQLHLSSLARFAAFSSSVVLSL
jgi:hypothetical protein